MKSIITLSRYALALSATAVLMFSVVMPVMAQVVVDRSVIDGAENMGTGASLNSCGSIATDGASGIVRCIAGFFNAAIYLIISAAVVYIVWGAFTMLRSEEKREEGKKVIMYGIIGLFVMVSIWGFVNILVNTFGTSRGQIDIPVLIK